ncbi:taste receptor type 2 member 14-like [Oryctolagus cuniculus]|uniref:taste receptor type 2 member 14-like n=1 Tax=Oryctolagus cuniculus TaxID=9986 RepID=UPI0001CE1451|nr:taste receptor type 2 member 14-like [Oryctolagus cuniculus]
MDDLPSITTAIVGMEFIIGILGNGLIALVNIIDWVKRSKISAVDQILTALAISRIIHLSSRHLSKLFSMVCPGLLWAEQILKMIHIIWMVTSHFSIWLATSLSIFYFLKIANFSNSIFHYLKWRVEKVISVTLLVSLVILFLNIAFLNTDTDVWVAGYKRNVTNSSSSKDSLNFSRHFLLHYMIFTIIPFTLSLTAFILLIFSLWRHLRKKQLNATAPRDARTKAHLQGLQAVVAFLLLYTFFFLSLLIQVLISDLQEKNVIISLCHVLAMAFPSGHSYILILRNKKLRQASLSMLWWLRSRVKDAEP